MRNFALSLHLRCCLLIGGALLLAAGCSSRSANLLRSATGMISHTICAGVFISGQEAAQVYRENFDSAPGFRSFNWALGYSVDSALKEVRATAFGGVESRALYHDGRGCTVLPAGAEPPSPLPEAVATMGSGRGLDIAGPALVETDDPALQAALDAAFAENVPGEVRQTKAVVVLQHGRVIAERYAPGYGTATRLHGWSDTKSVTSALIGILVREGRLRLEQPAPVQEWQGAADPRRAITLEMLLRQTSGLGFEETGSGVDPNSQMLFGEPDMARYAATAPLEAAPGSRWAYASGNALLLSRIVRESAGGSVAAVRDFMRRELFQPLGMDSALMEFDAAGTPVGGSYCYATARDWARFGQLYLQDGVVNGRRILPPGWVGFSAEPTPLAPVGYGAGWWTNRGDSRGATTRVSWGMPPDSFYASGYLGQYVIVVPSADLVIVRFGITQIRPIFDARGISRLVAEVVSALRRKP